MQSRAARIQFQKRLRTRRGGREIGKGNPVYCFPVVGRHHLDRIPGTAIEKRAIGTLADALLATNAKVRINFDAAERWMIFVGNPEHAGFDGTILDAGRGAGATGAAVGCNRKYARPLLTRRLAVALGHWKIFVYDVVQSCSVPQVLMPTKSLTQSNIAPLDSSTNCDGSCLCL